MHQKNKIMTRKTDARRKSITPLMVALTLSLFASAGLNPKALALETSPAATTAAGNDYALEPDAKAHQAERTEITALLNTLETQWNAHDLDGLMSNYSEEYTNNDGLNKKAVRLITQRFWSQYPDSKSTSKIKQIRVDGAFATVESKDVATGTTDKENQMIGTKGDLESVSEGQVYLKKQGNSWKIIGDRIDFEKVRVSFGLGKQLNSNFTAPEQVRSGKQFSAKIELSLPIGLSALGTITSQALRYPQPEEKESSEKLLRGLDNNALERIMIANKENRNELIMATVGIMNSARHILGITVLTRRVNVVPNLPDETDKIEDIADKSDGTAAKKSDSSADSKSKTGASSESSDAKNKESKKDDSKKDSHEKSGTDKK
jgi:ketosteroid isomerase-like protein